MKNNRKSGMLFTLAFFLMLFIITPAQAKKLPTDPSEPVGPNLKLLVKPIRLDFSRTAKYNKEAAKRVADDLKQCKKNYDSCFETIVDELLKESPNGPIKIYQNYFESCLQKDPACKNHHVCGIDTPMIEGIFDKVTFASGQTFDVHAKCTGPHWTNAPIVATCMIKDNPALYHYVEFSSDSDLLFQACSNTKELLTLDYSKTVWCTEDKVFYKLSDEQTFSFPDGENKIGLFDNSCVALESEGLPDTEFCPVAIVPPNTTYSTGISGGAVTQLIAGTSGDACRLHFYIKTKAPY